MNEVFHNTDDVVEVTEDWIERLKAAAAASPLKRSRLCLHRSTDDRVHEMIIALRKEILVRPHHHPEKSESFHMIEGHLAVLIFTDDGTVCKRIDMGPAGSGRISCFRLSTPRWHTVIPISEVAVFHETTAGPFVPGDAVFAEWAPSEQSELRGFLNRHLEEAAGRIL